MTTLVEMLIFGITATTITSLGATFLLFLIWLSISRLVSIAEESRPEEDTGEPQCRNCGSIDLHQLAESSMFECRKCGKVTRII